ncbi:PREDICTED: KH domain-containing protein akap-1 [Dinoponera quadriceps]|uniref:KH domain-containing protein akap-1 n=1 Tax=Dinoponera quadriceps TaxID=609295 RepID=A0A6P3WPX2_DINQU|nr:PREDICTED: KH domain-containing protein akap-1 [Dinoponera quadriceps]XP_014467808.1 PREDICTED: KH domain-containing protein akap-1 [Dinoponera quadriceps]XP_014467809.1 PREDICTED: KH domain-containing protein akap-1 [Dinoponera quadriceps]
MMYSTNVQLVKWTFPAVALIFGLFWYKRRRIHRADPGGIVESNSQDRMMTSYLREVNSNFYDNSTNEETNQSFSTSSCTQQEEPARVPRKVSENMDIPTRKSVPQSCDSSCTEVKPTTDIQLGSNPSTSYLETIVMGRNTPSSFNIELGNNITRVFEDVTEEERCSSAHQNETGSSERKDTEFNCNMGKQLTEEHPEDAIGAAVGQTAYERDSANHSPISGVLEGSIIDEARSEEGSTDSGKGGSINGYRKTNVEQTTYYFAIPQQLVGRLIGRHGSFLHNIRTKAEIQIYVNDHPDASDQKICSIEGNADGIAIALDMIRKKFPEKKFPEVTLIEISTSEVMPVETSWVPHWSQLFLIEGVNNDIVVTHIVKPHWLFIQVPTHPTFPFLRLLDAEMTYAYNNMESSVPNVLTRGMIYVAYWQNMWARVCMEKPDLLGERHKMRLLDHGGYYEFSSSQIRDIMPEYLNLPFQAIEIFLAHIQPKNGVWLDGAYEVIAQICCGAVGQAQVEGYVDSNVYTNIYYNFPKYGVLSLADELVARGFAERAKPEDIIPETSLELFEEPAHL